jgi:hypothetical protein
MSGENKSKKKDTDLNQEKIQSLQEMIANAEQTILSAKQILAQVSGANKATQKPTASSEESGDGERIFFGNFDGQIMIGEDGKQYPVPANYASKSKLVEGDTLKLSITSNGHFVYKQVGPAERKYIFGIIELDEKGNYIVNAEGKKYKMLLAAATYFKIEAGDEITLIIPQDKNSEWGAIENVLRKASDATDNIKEIPVIDKTKLIKKEKYIEIDEKAEAAEDDTKKPSAIERLEKEIEEERKEKGEDNESKDDIMDEWLPDLEEIKKETSHPVGATEK